MSDTFALTGDTETAPKGMFDRSIVDDIWDAAEKIAGNDRGLWRQDKCGTMIRRSDYGKSSSSYGWEVVDTLDGLKAVHFDNR